MTEKEVRMHGSKDENEISRERERERERDKRRIGGRRERREIQNKEQKRWMQQGARLCECCCF